MLEGLRAAPWFQEFARRGQLGIADCGDCMNSTTKLERQYKGCGYEPPLDGRVRLTVWQPPAPQKQGGVGFRGADLTTCAGYTANLPEVTEAAIARAHWKNGQLQFVEGTKTEELLNAVLILDSESSAVEGWMMTPSKDGGGGP